MKRFLIAVIAALFGVSTIMIGSVFAQGGTAGEGFPPQSNLYNDAVLLARVLPLVAAFGIGFGIWRGKLGLRERKSAPTSTTVIRHDWGTVIAHWANALGFMTGMVTGLLMVRGFNLGSTGSIILDWIPRADEARGLFAIHYLAAGLTIFGVASHLTQHGITGGFGLIPRSLKDLREGLGELLVEYTGIAGGGGAALGIKLPKGLRTPLAQTFAAFGLRTPKQLGKYLPAEKVFSYAPWAIIVTVIVITGIVKSFRYLYPIPPEFIATMTFLHDLSALAAIVMLGLHLAAVCLIPRNWPLLISMFTTRVPRQHVEQHHPIWFKQLVAQEQGESSASAAPDSAPRAKESKA